MQQNKGKEQFGNKGLDKLNILTSNSISDSKSNEESFPFESNEAVIATPESLQNVENNILPNLHDLDISSDSVSALNFKNKPPIFISSSSSSEEDDENIEEKDPPKQNVSNSINKPSLESKESESYEEDEEEEELNELPSEEKESVVIKNIDISLKK